MDQGGDVVFWNSDQSRWQCTERFYQCNDSEEKNKIMCVDGPTECPITQVSFTVPEFTDKDSFEGATHIGVNNN